MYPPKSGHAAVHSKHGSPIVRVLTYVVARRACGVHGEIEAAFLCDVLEDGLAHGGTTDVPEADYEDRGGHIQSVEVWCRRSGLGGHGRTT